MAEIGRRRLTVNLVSRDNGVGLSVDMALLEAMLTKAGHEVRRVDWLEVAMHRCDVAIFLELWSPRLTRYADRVVGVFNLEWFQGSWARDLNGIHQLWAKSLEAQNVYERRRLRTSTYTGFLSRDLYDPGVERTLSCIHIKGHSDLKNTEAVVEAWRADPTLPPLTIISNEHVNAPDYVRVLGRVSDEDLRRELNAAAIHVCPSRAEGWGHYITEALSVQALVITTDASPMNEHVRPEWGILIPVFPTGRRGMVSEYQINAQVVGDAVRRAVALSPEERIAMGKRARAHFDHRNATFTQTALDLLARI